MFAACASENEFEHRRVNSLHILIERLAPQMRPLSGRRIKRPPFTVGQCVE